jgi:hypothetical protein
MSASDVIQICNIVATVLAVIAAPVIALWIGGKLQARENVRQEQLKLLGVLLSLRHQPLSPEIFRALNLIDAVFADATDVREMWSKYYSALSDPNLQNQPGYAVREEKRRDLMIAIVKRLGLQKKISTSDLLRTYIPAAVIEANTLEMWERIKRREDLRPEFIKRGIGFPEYDPPYFPPQPGPQPPQPDTAVSPPATEKESSN